MLSSDLSASRFCFRGPADLEAVECNCSICAMKRNAHVIVPASALQIIRGDDSLQLYQVCSNAACARLSLGYHWPVAV